MTARMLCIILFLISLVYMGGCASTVRILPDEIDEKQPTKFVMAVVPAKIIEATLSSSDPEDTVLQVIAFDNLGGKLDSERKIVTGIAQDGILIEIAFEDILYVKVVGTDIGIRNATVKNMEASRDNAKEKSKMNMTSPESVFWDEISFDEYGGKYDPTSETIVGTSKRGKPVEIKRDQVHFLQYKRYYPYRDLRFVVGLSGLVAFYFGIKNIF